MHQLEEAAASARITLTAEEIDRLEKLGDETGVHILREWEKEMRFLTAEEMIKCFRENTEIDKEKELTASDLFQEAIKITMEMNSSYHTPEELREIMSRLIGKKVDDTFRLFPPFYTDFGKIFPSEKMFLSTPAVIFKIKAALQSGMVR